MEIKCNLLTGNEKCKMNAMFGELLDLKMAHR